MGRRGWAVVAGGLIVFLLAIGFAKMPVPYVALAPGRVVDTLGVIGGQPVIQIEGVAVSNSQGELNLTTVTVYDGIDLITALRFWADDEIAVVPREVVYPPGVDEKKVDAKNEADWVESQHAAEVAALTKLGYPAIVSVTGFAKDSPSEGKLELGDVLTAVDGAPAETSLDLVEAVRSVSPGEIVRVSYLRAGTPGEAEIRTVEAKGNPKEGSIGITFEQKQPHDFTVEFDVKGIGGPSAGLMFALGIVDKVDTVDLTGGKDIAGTGTITMDGKVGPIGGISQKMLGARGDGATIFLTPEENCPTAKRTVPDGLRLVKVNTLDDALQSLAMLRDHTGTPPKC